MTCTIRLRCTVLDISLPRAGGRPAPVRFFLSSRLGSGTITGDRAVAGAVAS